MKMDMSEDYACVGYDNAGFIEHCTVGEKWLCQSTAKQIRRFYKSVRVVNYEKYLSLLEENLRKRRREITAQLQG